MNREQKNNKEKADISGHYEENSDSDADAFAFLSIMLIVGLTIVYYISNQ